jgi:hypothetical protein
MKTSVITALFLATSLPVLAQPAVSRATVQQALGFEDQTSAALTGWHAYRLPLFPQTTPSATPAIGPCGSSVRHSLPEPFQ